MLAGYGAAYVPSGSGGFLVDALLQQNCSICKFGIFQQEGYSNWTVDGVSFYCALDAHPEDGFDAWYQTDDRLNFGAECVIYTEGQAINMDVDREDYADLRPEQKYIYDKWQEARP